MVSIASPYPKTLLQDPSSLGIENRAFFVGIDLAPNDGLETGVAVLDRERKLIRMDKLYTDQDILNLIKSLGPSQNVIAAIDVPKSLNIQGKWRQEEIKMHPLRLIRQRDGSFTDRYSQRAKTLYRLIDAQDTLVFLYFNYLAKMHYNLMIPFRTRTPQGCRSLQSLIKLRLAIPNVPTNLAPSSVLDAMIGAYTGWLLYEGKKALHYQLYVDPEELLYLEPFKCAHQLRPRKRLRRHRITS